MSNKLNDRKARTANSTSYEIGGSVVKSSFVLPRLNDAVGQGIPYVAGTDTGNAVKNENKVREQVKKPGQKGKSPLRKADPHTE